jgi:putative membrane protein
MKPILTIPAILLSALLLQSCGNSDNKSTDADTSAIDSIRDSTVANHDAHGIDADANNETTFLNAAAVGGMMEVEAATVAASKSNNTAVKEFALMMLKDHGKANQEVKTLATKLSIAIPTALPDEHAMHIKDLQKLYENKFDQQYITMMINDHAKTVKLFKSGSELPNADLKAFATKTLPVIQSHYDKAVAIAKTLNLSNTGNGDDIIGVSPSEGTKN